MGTVISKVHAFWSRRIGGNSAMPCERKTRRRSIFSPAGPTKGNSAVHPGLASTTDSRDESVIRSAQPNHRMRDARPYADSGDGRVGMRTWLIRTDITSPNSRHRNWLIGSVLLAWAVLLIPSMLVSPERWPAAVLIAQ